ncbi:MAG: DEAD/DEAH box helicase [Candidatus Heimdallarchaeota archaeon]
MTTKEKVNSWSKRKEAFPFEAEKPREWVTIHKLPMSQPRKMNEITWQNLLPSYAQMLAEVIESVVGSAHPFEHQEQAIKHLLRTTNKKKITDLIINGGTFSGKSLSFIVPGIVKQLNEETDFVVIFYPSKQLLLDQFERVKEYLVKLEERSGVRLTCKMYSGDIGKTSDTNQAQQRELIETEQNPPNILLATFDKFWYHLITGKKNPLIEKIITSQYIVFDEIHAFEGFAAAIIKGFIKVHKIKNPQSQIILSSATIDNVERFRDDFLPSANIITCPPVRGEQEFLGTTVDHTVSLLAELWEELEAMPGKFCLVFLDSKEDIEFLTERLCKKLKQKYPYFDSETVAMIHADLPYNQRKKILDETRKESRNIIRILLSSSVLELGVNIPNVQVVINVGIPITQKDGIVQRFARNRSVPGEKRVNVFIFDLAKKRDSFYWNHKEILAGILETNACNPILYPRQNPKILAGLIILHLRYGITNFEEIMKFFLDESVHVYEHARLQYTKLVSLMVLKKEQGKILFTSQGGNILLEQAKKKNVLVPFSIRAIKTNWSIKQIQGISSDWHTNQTTNLGKISSLDVLKKGLPGNIIVRNKQQFLITDIDHHRKIIFVKPLITRDQSFSSANRLTNRLYDPKMTIGVFPKTVKGTKLVDINFGQVFIQRRPVAIVNSSLEELALNHIETGKKKTYFWQELTQQQSDEFAITEKSDGVVFTLKTDLPKTKELTTKKILEYLGKILQIEIENVLSIPANEFAIAYNSNQLALSDKGDPNGNSEYLFLHLQKIAMQALKRLSDCSCARGCKNCYGEIIGLLPEGMKDYLKILINDLVGISGAEFHEELLEEIPPTQLNSHENKIIAFSDIHLGSELCYQEEFFKAITQLSKEADILIINGDLLDKASENGWDIFNRFRALAIKEGFWTKLVLIRSSSIHDGNLDQFSGFLHQDYALLEIGSKQVLFVHGNKIGINPAIVKSDAPEVAAQQAKKDLVKHGRLWLPTITSDTHLVIGHLHYRFYNERYRVYGLGYWMKKGKERHQKCLMIIDSTNELDTIQLQTYS